MTPIIHILDAISANQISAGEVVERPASVVKELIENSLDAGAKHIDIAIEGNGVPLIRVQDDGCGIGSTDLPLAIIRHATSKITQIGDLDRLQTLGFRGEALPSIASVSHMEISTRAVGETEGLCLILKGGKQEEIKEIGCPVGTCVTVRDLFFNTPARLKFLKSASTEFGQISDTIGRIALAHPDIGITLTHPHQTVMQTYGRGNLRETIASVLGHNVARQLIPIDIQNETWRLKGFISPPNLARLSKQAQYFMVNGRTIRSPILSRALAEGYHTLIPSKLHPIAVLHLFVPPSDYDVNVHPTKMDVRFKEEQALTLFIRDAVYRTLINSNPLPSIHSHQSESEQTLQTPPGTKTIPPVTVSKSQNQMKSQTSESPAACDYKENNNKPVAQVSEEAARYNQLQLTFKQQIPNAVEQSRTHSASNSFSKNSACNPKIFSITNNGTEEKNPDPSESQRELFLNHVWPLAQLFNTYILATNGTELFIIDQHAAHERINYERLLKEFKAADKPSQVLLVPLSMEFTLQEEQALLENLWILSEMGFTLEQFGSRTYLLRGVPVQTGGYQPDELLRKFIDQVLIKNSPPTFDKILEEWIYMLACKESIKGNDSLSILEMEQLIARLLNTENPYTCPHGRPTMITMTRSELEKRFYRK